MTIFALASGRGKAGIAVVRVSGAGAAEAVRRLIRREADVETRFPSPRQAVMRAFVDPETGEVIDRGVVLWFPAPHSFTGEDVAEFQVHGGRAVISRLASALSSMPGIRMAEPGEFSRRAFENGKMDLTEAEGLADLVNAETEGQRRQAVRQLDGELGRLYEGWRRALISVMAQFETAIDFADEELPPDLLDKGRLEMAELRDAITAHLADGHRGERLRDGIYCAIVGPPNYGKSSLLNALARRDIAIVSDRPGTTRDVLEAHLDLGGFPVIVADTAGLREASDEIESEGVRRALARAEAADIRIVLCDARRWPDIPAEVGALIGPNTIVAVNKCDLKEVAVGQRGSGIEAPVPVCAVSAVSGEGVAALVGEMTALAEAVFDDCGPPALTRERHRQALEGCVDYLNRALDGERGDKELMAEDLRLAARALGRITGRVDVEDILDVVFRDFCIGK
ncbi:MAG: tRNA uridine-5-carboxymethylaminomethyl(34) synthesis GTPase MnmE [Sphingomonadales bacterium]